MDWQLILAIIGLIGIITPVAIYFIQKKSEISKDKLKEHFEMLLIAEK
ncbi:hypothetical protein ACFLU2_00525 [Chloroflexota bacterium]